MALAREGSAVPVSPEPVGDNKERRNRPGKRSGLRMRAAIARRRTTPDKFRNIEFVV